jgi:predicted  nucleic acid-binding Zn-ribbon protein
MGYKDMISTWQCGKCGTIHDDDDSDNEFVECWKCDNSDRKKTKHESELDDIRKEMKRMETEYKRTMKRADELSDVRDKELDILRNKLHQAEEHANTVDDELKKVRKRVTTLETRLGYAFDMIVDAADDINVIKDEGTCLNEDNIKSIKKIARKTAIKQVVKWDSD